MKKILPRYWFNIFNFFFSELIGGKLSGKSVVELGSGTGAVGLVASVLGKVIHRTTLGFNTRKREGRDIEV